MGTKITIKVKKRFGLWLVFETWYGRKDVRRDFALNAYHFDCSPISVERAGITEDTGVVRRDPPVDGHREFFGLTSIYPKLVDKGYDKIYARDFKEGDVLTVVVNDNLDTFVNGDYSDI